MSYQQFTQCCQDCRKTWNAAFGIVGTTQVAAPPKECPFCKSERIVFAGYGWLATNEQVGEEKEQAGEEVSGGAAPLHGAPDLSAASGSLRGSDVASPASSLRVLRELVQKWREQVASGLMPTDREIGVENCANELEAALASSEPAKGTLDGHLLMLKHFINSDALAVSFQTMGQYRTKLLELVNEALQANGRAEEGKP